MASGPVGICAPMQQQQRIVNSSPFQVYNDEGGEKKIGNLALGTENFTKTGAVQTPLGRNSALENFVLSWKGENKSSDEAHYAKPKPVPGNYFYLHGNNGTQVIRQQSQPEHQPVIRRNGMSHSMDHSRLQGVLYPIQGFVAKGAQRIPQKIGSTMQNPSSPRKSSGGAYRNPNSGSAKTSRRSSWQEPGPLDCVPQVVFPTNFARVLRDTPVPVPPILLRNGNGNGSQVCGPTRQKDASDKIKVSLRVTSSSNHAGTEPGPSSSPESRFLTVDQRKKQVTVIETSPSSGVPRTNPTASGKHSVPKIFGFDAVYGKDDSLTEICSGTLTEVIQTVIHGSDACLLSIGQSSPGKSHTVFGSDHSAQTLGLFPTGISWLFRLINENRQKNSSSRFSVRVSAIEVCGPQEELRDLLVNFAPQVLDKRGNPKVAPIEIREDPVLGTQLHNLSEIRTPSAEKAAFLLDAALAARNGSTVEEQRNSHMFFTIHIYQYKVESGKTGVAGGRTRLQLVDLGSGEKSSKHGRTSLTMPALGNVLLTLLQGQKYLPFKESRLTQLLKDVVSSTSCRSVSVMAHVSADPEKQQDTLNCLQIASRLQRIKKQKKTRLGVGSQHSSGGESSSCDERARRRLQRSASDPECTSSSEQSECTVIYLGEKRFGIRGGIKGPNTSDRELTTDNESPPSTLNAQERNCSQSESLAPPVAAVSALKSGHATGGYCSAPVTPRHRQSPRLHAAQPGGQFFSPQLQRLAQPKAETWIDGPKADFTSCQGGSAQTHVYHELQSPVQKKGAKQKEFWIDGPNASLDQLQNFELKVSAPKPPPLMDPYKREMIQKWVSNQESERMDAWNDQERAVKAVAKRREEAQAQESSSPPELTVLSPSSVPLTSSPSDVGAESSNRSSSVMETSSSDSAGKIPVETRDMAIQIEEAEIDFELGRVTEANQYLWTYPEPEMRFLEDIQEEEETQSSEAHSSKSGRCSVASGTSHLNRLRNGGYRDEGCRNEALAALPHFDPLTLGGLEMLGMKPEDFHLGQASSSVTSEEHPLRILSKEGVYDGMAGRSDSFSVTSEHLECLSLPATDQLDEESIPTDEDLEKAMEASLTSIRSHEILEKLKTESQWQELRDKAQKMREKENTDHFNGNSYRRSFGAENLSPVIHRKVAPLTSFKSDDLSNFGDEDFLEEITRLEPDGASMTDLGKPKEKDGQSIPTASRLVNPNILLCCQASMTSSGSSGQSGTKYKLPADTKDVAKESIRSEKLHKPTIPALPKSVSREITMKLSSISHQSSSRGSKSENSSPRIEPGTSSLPASRSAPKARSPLSENRKEIVTESGLGSFSRPTKLPTVSVCGPKAGWGSRRDSGSNSKAKATKSAPKKTDIPKPLPAPKTRAKSSEKSAAAAEKKSSSTSTNAKTAGKSQLMSFLRSPTKSSKNSPTAPGPVSSKSPSNRASSGYDSGHDSGIVAGGTVSTSGSPELLMSPYTKVTKPRASQRSSSGHGSDNSSVQSYDLPRTSPKGSKDAVGKTGSRLTTIFAGKNKTRNRESVATSSGYESGGQKCDSSDAGTAFLAPSGGRTSTGLDSDVLSTGSSVRSPPSAKLGRKKYFGSIPLVSSHRSQSAPQSPCENQKHLLRLHESQLLDFKAQQKHHEDNRVLKFRERQFSAIKKRQLELKEELRMAKERIGIPENKWSYELHVESCMDLSHPGLIEALEQETKILEKRVIACKSHAFLVTVFDAIPPRS